MPGRARGRLVALALRCYPQAWRARHEEEARELAALLAEDGVPFRSTAWSYFKGATRERLTPSGQARRWRTGLSALVAGASLVAMSLLVSVSPAPAGAMSVVRAIVTNRDQAAAELDAVFRAHHFDISVQQVPVSPSLVGSILSAKATGPSTGSGGILGRISGPCAGGATGCTQGILLPSHFSGHGLILVGRPAKPGEGYAESADIFRPGELLAGSQVLDGTVGAALPLLHRLEVQVMWYVDGAKARSAAEPHASYYVVGGDAVSSVSICLDVAPSVPATMGPRS